MNFSKHKLHQYLSEGQAVSVGAQGSLDTSNNSAAAATNGGMAAKEQQMGNKARQRNQSAQATGPSQKSNVRYEQSAEYNKNLLKEKEALKSFESQKSDWRTELQEKVVDGQERENHPFVTVMPTGDENLIQAVKQMGKEVKNKKDHVEGQMKEEVQVLEEKKKKKECKDGYYRDEDGDCVKKKKKRTTVIMGRGWGYGGHHHHDDEGEGEDGGGGDGGGEGGGDGGGGGMGEMFDILGDMLLQEKEMHFRDAQKAGMTKGSPKKPIKHPELNAKRVANYVPPLTSDKDRAKD